jgi:uncharacterized protein
MAITIQTEKPTAAPPQQKSYGNVIFALVLLTLGIVLFFSVDTKVAAPDFEFQDFLGLWAILFFAGCVSGMTGFAFSTIGNLSQLLLPPVSAVPMLQGLSFVNQITSITKLRKDMPRKLKEWFPYGPGPAVIGGLICVQLGVWMLNNLPGPVLTLLIGGVVFVYSVYLTFKPEGYSIKAKWFGGPATGVVVGGLGGLVGGFTGFPGVSVVMWTGLRAIAKAQVRAIVQPFIIILNGAAIISGAIQNPAKFGVGYFLLLALTLPAVLPGTLTGVWIYHKLSERQFKRAVYVLLFLVGTLLVIKGWTGLSK